MPKSLPPIIGVNPKILILGSKPGEESKEAGEYYKNKHNFFWKFLFKYFNQEFSADYETRKKLITKNGIALCDVLESWEYKNGVLSSKDSDIVSPVPNMKIENIVREHNITAILLNGGKAHAEFKKHFKSLYKSGICRALKSTSPLSRCVISEEDLYLEWKRTLDEFFS